MNWTFWITLGLWTFWGMLMCYLNCHKKSYHYPADPDPADTANKGYVYVVSNARSFGKGIYKIGMTRRKDPMQRIGELNDASVPFPFEIHALIETNDAPALERKLHKLFHVYRVNKNNMQKEFFKVDLDLIKREVEKLGYPWN